MDPLSIAASVGGLTTICVAIAKTLSTVCDRLKGASQVVNSLRSEARTISFSLSQLQTILLGDVDSVPSKALLDPELLSTVDIALTGCSVTLSCLEEEIRSLVTKLTREDGLSLVNRAEVGWKDDKFKELLYQLRGQYGAIALLLNGLQMKSLTDIHRLLNDNQEMIKQTESRAESLRGLFPHVHVAESTFETPGEVDSVFGDMFRSSGTEKEFDFDNIVTSSQAYRRVVAAGTRRALLDTRDQQKIDEDLIDLGIVLVDVSSTVETLNSSENTKPNHDLDLLIIPVDYEEAKSHQGLSDASEPVTATRLQKQDSKEVIQKRALLKKVSEENFKKHDQQSSSSIKVIKGPRDIMREREARRKARQEEEEEEEEASKQGPENEAAKNIGKYRSRREAAADSQTEGAPRRQQDKGKAVEKLASVPSADMDSASIEQVRRIPNAFERWESLSAHWEGLTSFWIRRLEENSVEVNCEPLEQQLSRQVTDLAAAGANLFHAVVELQRLRASSERKFQRWFFETRVEQERSQELMAMVEASLEEERKRVDKLEKLCRAAEEDLGSSEQALGVEVANAKRLKKRVEEAEAELRIAKTEAKRAWEELGSSQGEKTTMLERLQGGELATIGRLTLVPMMPKSSHEGAPSTVLLCQLFWN